jgi:rifampicin phosphotransferase
MVDAPGAECLFVWLDAAPASRDLVGGKGASLSRLAALGAPVPLAFALTTHAYSLFAASHGLPCRASEVADDDLPALRAQIVGAEIPLPVADVVVDGYRAFQAGAGSDGVALAVRSSATAEDSEAFSFAGLHDTVLDVRTLPALEAAVRQCWASLWSERAVSYRRAGGLAADEAAIAVVVQQLVRSDASFVVFTADPVGDRDGHLIIAATWGLGEAVVSGLVVPDHIVVDPKGQVVEYTVGDKHLMVIPGARPEDGTREVPVPRALRTAPALSNEQASAIATMARDLAPRLGYEADLEGAFSADALYLFQARPITTLNANGRARAIVAAGTD